MCNKISCDWVLNMDSPEKKEMFCDKVTSASTSNWTLLMIMLRNRLLNILFPFSTSDSYSFLNVMPWLKGELLLCWILSARGCIYKSLLSLFFRNMHVSPQKFAPKLERTLCTLLVPPSLANITPWMHKHAWAPHINPPRGPDQL